MPFSALRPLHFLNLKLYYTKKKKKKEEVLPLCHVGNMLRNLLNAGPPDPTSALIHINHKTYSHTYFPHLTIV
jgi:hypothetical protein